MDEGNYPLSSFTFHIKRLLKSYIKDGTEVSGKNNKCPKCGCKTKLIYDYGFGVTIGCIDCRYTFDIEEPKEDKHE